MPHAEQLTNSRNVLLTVLGTGSPRLGCQHDWVRDLFQVADFLLYSHMAERTKDSSPLWDLFYKVTNPTYEGPILMTSSPPKGPTF